MFAMKINNLTVDLLQDQASIALFKQGQPKSPNGPSEFTSVNVNVPILTPGDQSESHIRRIALGEARRALEEAIKVLDASELGRN